MRLRAVLLACLIVLGALAAVAYARVGGEEKPTVGELIGSSVRAAAGQEDAKVRYAVTAKVDATPSAAASEETQRFLSAPVSLSASGGLSEEAVTLAGTVGFMGTTYRAEALVGQDETYVNLLGRWYGDRTQGLRDAQRSAEQQAGSRVDRAKLERALRWIHDHADEVLDAEVTAGPDIDGKTWQAAGRCKPAGLITLAERSGKAVTAEDRRGIEAFCELAEFTYVVGAGDRLPRRLRIAADGDAGTLRELAASSGDDSPEELDALAMEFDVRLTQWGEDVEFEAPADAVPMKEIGGALMGLLFSAMS